MGTNSCQCNFLPHEKQNDLPPKVIPVLYLRAQTFKKLPMTAPSIKKAINKYDSITVQLHYKNLSGR